MFLKISQNSQEITSAGVPFLVKLEAETCNFIKKEALEQVVSCEFCEISKNTFLQNTLAKLLLISEQEVNFCMQYDISGYAGSPII